MRASFLFPREVYAKKMNPEVLKFAESFESRVARGGRHALLNENELRFLDQVYGPEFGFNFQGLTAQLPFQDYKGGERYVDFSYENGSVRLLIEVDSLKYHAEGISHQKYDDHQERQNDMILTGGWILLRFTANMIRRNPMLCRRQLVQAVGKSLIASRHHLVLDEEQLWQRRKSEIIRLAGEGDVLKPGVVANRYHIHRRTAAAWLQRIVNEGALAPVKSRKLVTGYTLPPTQKPTPRSDVGAK